MAPKSSKVTEAQHTKLKEIAATMRESGHTFSWAAVGEQARESIGINLETEELRTLCRVRAPRATTPRATIRTAEDADFSTGRADRTRRSRSVPPRELLFPEDDTFLSTVTPQKDQRQQAHADEEPERDHPSPLANVAPPSPEVAANQAPPSPAELTEDAAKQDTSLSPSDAAEQRAKALADSLRQMLKGFGQAPPACVRLRLYFAKTPSPKHCLRLVDVLQLMGKPRVRLGSFYGSGGFASGAVDAIAQLLAGCCCITGSQDVIPSQGAQPVVTIGFQTLEGRVLEASFTHQPLGFRLGSGSEGHRIEDVRAGGQAHGLGVQEGSTILEIDHQPVNRLKSLEHLLNRVCQKLPREGTSAVWKLESDDETMSLCTASLSEWNEEDSDTQEDSDDDLDDVIAGERVACLRHILHATEHNALAASSCEELLAEVFDSVAPALGKLSKRSRLINRPLWWAASEGGPAWARALATSPRFFELTTQDKEQRVMRCLLEAYRKADHDIQGLFFSAARALPDYSGVADADLVEKVCKDGLHLGHVISFATSGSSARRGAGPSSNGNGWAGLL